MLFRSGVLLALAGQAALCRGAAGAADDVEAETTETVALPSHTPFVVEETSIFEQFGSGAEERWVRSTATRTNKDGEDVFSYVGEWAIEEPVKVKGMEGKRGLVVKDVAAHHAISMDLDTPFVSDDESTLVLQYEVKPQDGLQCGGAYVKLLREPAGGSMGNHVPYVIMFGPDRCGSTNKVHFIFNHRNPKTGVYEEKHLKMAPATQLTAGMTNLYTLIVRPDQTYEILINQKSVRDGSLLADFLPAVNPLPEIDDPEDFKPVGWVDVDKIPDEDAVKPDDWDEEAPFEIEDMDAVMPEGWLDQESDLVPDPDAVKPAEWDDEEDGVWVAPIVPNPKCADAPGCGPWVRPTKRNPAYKGKWLPPLKDNPAYKGPWAPRRIANPDYFEDKHPSHFDTVHGLGFELWTMQGNILFDNIYLGHSEAEAKDIAAQTFVPKRAAEDEIEGAAKKAAGLDDGHDHGYVDSFLANPYAFTRARIDNFIMLANFDPVLAVKSMPEFAAALAAAVLTLLAVLSSSVYLLLKPAAKAKPAADSKPAEAKATEEPAEEPAEEPSSEPSDSGIKTRRKTRAVE